MMDRWSMLFRPRIRNDINLPSIYVQSMRRMSLESHHRDERRLVCFHERESLWRSFEKRLETSRIVSLLFFLFFSFPLSLSLGPLSISIKKCTSITISRGTENERAWTKRFPDWFCKIPPLSLSLSLCAGEDAWLAGVMGAKLFRAFYSAAVVGNCRECRWARTFSYNLGTTAVIYRCVCFRATFAEYIHPLVRGENAEKCVHEAKISRRNASRRHGTRELCNCRCSVSLDSKRSFVSIKANITSNGWFSSFRLTVWSLPRSINKNLSRN